MHKHVLDEQPSSNRSFENTADELVFFHSLNDTGRHHHTKYIMIAEIKNLTHLNPSSSDHLPCSKLTCNLRLHWVRGLLILKTRLQQRNHLVKNFPHKNKRSPNDNRFPRFYLLQDLCNNFKWAMYEPQCPKSLFEFSLHKSNTRCTFWKAHKPPNQSLKSGKKQALPFSHAWYRISTLKYLSFHTSALFFSMLYCKVHFFHSPYPNDLNSTGPWHTKEWLQDSLESRNC